MKKQKSPLAKARRQATTVKAFTYGVLAICTFFLCCVTCFAASTSVDTSELQATIDNIRLVGTIIGTGLVIIGIILCGMKFSLGGREALAQAKGRIAMVVGGAICIFGAQGICSLLDSMTAFS